ncbi:major facilitator superfamily domain-containing protein [Lasiosphaeria ovina]|uniref:Major facilitator superfamily domain-containing protein n=1 Tax=Lasiosphaeria ovina TaxID=92902 RepID=A0AAE0KIT8_9PEZI|nr:major facilitator superfamily domain-containing protein [Lasiosphaeria ovina]
MSFPQARPASSRGSTLAPPPADDSIDDEKTAAIFTTKGSVDGGDEKADTLHTTTHATAHGDPIYGDSSRSSRDRTAAAVATAAATATTHSLWSPSHIAALDAHELAYWRTRVSPGHPSFLVGWSEPADAERPSDWRRGTKLLVAAAALGMAFAAAFASSVFSPAQPALAAEFGTGAAAAGCAVALWIAGAAAGAVLFRDLLWRYGSRGPLAFAFFGLAVWSIPAALARDIQSLLVFRFFAGASAAGVWVVAPFVCGQLFEKSAAARRVARGAVAACVALGVLVAPVAGAYIVHQGAAAASYSNTHAPYSSSFSWRWVGWATVIIGACCFGAAAFAVPEASSSVLLERKAKRLRLALEIYSLRAESETPAGRLEKRLDYAWLGKQPVISVVMVSSALVYGMLYLVVQGLPLAFQRRDWPATTACLPLLAVAVGLATGYGVFAVSTVARSKRGLWREKPEDHLALWIVGALILPPAFLWFGWSADTHWASQVAASVFVGLGLGLVFVSETAYLADAYSSCKAYVALLEVAVCGLVATSFPLWTGIVFDKLGVQWANTVVALICVVVVVPVPVVLSFYSFGARSWK